MFRAFRQGFTQDQLRTAFVPKDIIELTGGELRQTIPECTRRVLKRIEQGLRALDGGFDDSKVQVMLVVEMVVNVGLAGIGETGSGAH